MRSHASAELFQHSSARFNARRGSEQYHSMNSSIACWYDLRDCIDVRLLKDGSLGLVEFGQSRPLCAGLLAVRTFHEGRPPLPPPRVLLQQSLAGRLGCSQHLSVDLPW